jgi:hypothetical protein
MELLEFRSPSLFQAMATTFSFWKKYETVNRITSRVRKEFSRASDHGSNRTVIHKSRTEMFCDPDDSRIDRAVESRFPCHGATMLCGFISHKWRAASLSRPRMNWDEAAAGSWASSIGWMDRPAF